MSKKVNKIKVVKPVSPIRKVPLKAQVDRLTWEVKELEAENTNVQRAYELTVANLQLKIDWYNLLPWYSKVWTALKGEEL